MLSIGQDTGALVVYTSDRLLAREIEIRPHHGVWAGVHTAVRARYLGDTVLHAGVFGSLPCGLYDLRVRDTSSPGHDHPGHDHPGHDHPVPSAHTVPPAHTVPAVLTMSVLTVRVAPGMVTETTLVETDAGAA